jgi:hypothetical protein
MVSPWRRITPPDPAQHYLAMLTFLPLRGYAQIPRFMRYSFAIQKQVERSPGAIGISVRAKPMSNQYWTLSVWTDERALMDFVRKEPHARSMTAFHMGPTKFTRWKIAGSDVPPSWKDALRRGEEQAHG